MTNYSNPSDELYGIYISIQVFLDRYDDLVNSNLQQSMKKLSLDILSHYQSGNPDTNITEKYAKKNPAG